MQNVQRSVHVESRRPPDEAPWAPALEPIEPRPAIGYMFLVGLVAFAAALLMFAVEALRAAGSIFRAEPS